MRHDEDCPGWVAELLRRQRGVLRSETAAAWLGASGVRWRVTSGRWRRACQGVLVTHAGPLTADQALWVAVLNAGPEAALAGLTAARLDGLAGFDDSRTHLLVPVSRRVRTQLPNVRVHRSRTLCPGDIHPARQPPRTRLHLSLLDAASWAPNNATARGILAAGVQQRLVLAGQLTAAAAARPKIHRHALITATLGDIAAGAHATSELDFALLLRRYRIPGPDRQVMRVDDSGRRRWLDTYWDEARLVAEVDGMWHMEPLAWWADMRRDNEMTVRGYRVLRFPAFALRDDPETVAAQLNLALRHADSRVQ